jgi:uncharacterized membrane protein
MENENQQANDQQTSSDQGQAQHAPTPSADQHKAIAIIGYLIPILFFIPLITDAKNDQFAKYHANQHLLLLITWIIGSVLTFVLIGFLVYLYAIIAMIMGIVYAAQGQMKPIPLIGGITLLK